MLIKKNEEPFFYRFLSIAKEIIKKKIAYLENENYRLRIQNQRIHERNKRLSMIVKKRREEANNENRQRNCSM